ncbi:MAG: ATP-binding protein [Ramlibacter sp.]|nr:ATP-binding protein [Ramlibacter sp.]
MRPTLHFFCGKAGAGKSTLARQVASEQNALLICEDVWLARLFGDQMKTLDDYRRLALKLKSVVGPMVVDLLKSGQSVVLDFPANTRATRAWFRTVFESADAAHVLHFVQTPDAVCLERIGRRNVERPEGAHHLSEQDFEIISSFFEPPEEAEGLGVRVWGS